MALLEKYPVNVRKKIALGITIGVALLLLITMVFVYKSQKKPSSPDGSMTDLGRFYATILSNTQSYFGGNHAIMGK